LADQATADPIAMWRDWVSQSERQWNTFLNNAMSTDEFSQSMGRMMDVYLGMQKNMNETMGRYFSALNIPSRSDILSLGDRLGAIEDRLTSIESALTGMKAGKAAASDEPAAPRPPRTRKPDKN
jgi:polyhydroxyalkanoic acid synthase PhaR subunit